MTSILTQDIDQDVGGTIENQGLLSEARRRGDEPGELEDLDRVDRAVRLVGFVNSAPGFTDQPRVVNGATDLLVELYGERGMPTRAAIGCQGLALDSSVELLMEVTFTGTDLAPPLSRHGGVRA